MSKLPTSIRVQAFIGNECIFEDEVNFPDTPEEDRDDAVEVLSEVAKTTVVAVRECLDEALQANEALAVLEMMGISTDMAVSLFRGNFGLREE